MTKKENLTQMSMKVIMNTLVYQTNKNLKIFIKWRGILKAIGNPLVKR